MKKEGILWFLRKIEEFRPKKSKKRSNRYFFVAFSNLACNIKGL